MKNTMRLICTSAGAACSAPPDRGQRRQIHVDGKWTNGSDEAQHNGKLKKASYFQNTKLSLSNAALIRLKTRNQLLFS
jgi:hypothetical protein